ncbi:hypothetical protein GCM10008090_06980 [Arenicella chitinivorans]|uniref:Thioredoxin domain-containing protein n=1 Tax=Arenicella chitinivorans TaxID=1329800 RepID=A0A918RJ10_9GAMM|nr:thioredoxin domain-containing protein [Arenicella chitinivorans]GHA00650.1 hypothetical protein GCM10008090_06980 [Arenicella chitinivorans]
MIEQLLLNNWRDGAKLIRLQARQLACAVIALLLISSLTACGQQPISNKQAFIQKKGTYPIRTRHLDTAGAPLYTNDLIHENSAYLLQHAHNPVDWHAWTPKAFEQAKQEDKPILLSIGYSTCHWCHVMERESFEDLTIAKYINQHFIAIKVDREEHPDIDETYLTAVQMLSGKVGWPLTAVLTPDAEPFFGGTYFPPQQFLNLLEKISSTWTERRPAILEQASRLKTEMNKLSAVAKTAHSIDHETLTSARDRISSKLFAAPRYNEPGFPREPEMLFLMQQSIRHADAELMQRLSQRLETLADSGLHDHVGGGFHRYSVDAEWRIPHFEKMLYNQAQLAQVYAQAYQFTRNPRFKQVAKRTFDFMLSQRDGNAGGFYSALDAESDGDEGKFYVWPYTELKSKLTEAELGTAETLLGVTPQGNFEGKNVLWRHSEIERSTDLSASQVLHKLRILRQERRTPPAVDRKTITAWNGLAISALISGFEAINQPHYQRTAEQIAESLWDTAYSADAGLARIHSPKQRIDATLDDYTNLVRAYLDIFDTTTEAKWLRRAETLTQRMLKDFRDEKTGAFLISNKHLQRGLVVPIITARDDAMYSGNSVAAQNLARLFHRTGDIQYRDHARAVIAHFSSQIHAAPESASGLLMAASMLIEGEALQPHYAARGKVRVSSSLNENRLSVVISIQAGWHINADNVLNEYLIPTSLSTKDNSCTTIDSINFPSAKQVELGFQKDPLLVFDGDITINAKLRQSSPECAVAKLELRIQACSDQVCLSPATIELRTPTNQLSVNEAFNPTNNNTLHSKR